MTWYDQTNHRLWFRSNEIDPVTDPATQCGVVSSESQFHVTHASYVTLDGLQVQDGYDGIHIDTGTNAVVQNCRVIHCDNQGILVEDPYSEIAYNYVDAIGGEMVNTGQNGIRRDLAPTRAYMPPIIQTTLLRASSSTTTFSAGH